jgi:4-amino-4-deoxy-L-arabinose transferase-like glycosyltransferase
MDEKSIPVDTNSQEARLRLRRWVARIAPILLIAGLVVLHAVINSHWLADNVTLTGADKSTHLARSFRYHLTLSPLTLRSFFTTLVDNPIRPSLFHISSTLAYRLFGFSADSGPMINLFYMTILLAATYGLGVKLGGRKVGLLGTALLGTYPMVYAMSRYFYMESALTAMVAATIYFLISSDRFQNRMQVVLLGLCLGLGLLTKRTFAVFVLVPFFYVVFRSKLLPALWRAVTSRPNVHWRSLLIALAAGALLSGIWFFPNKESIAELVLGNWLFLVWWFLAALTIYLFTLPSAPEVNLLASLSLGASLASVWYVARIEFILRATSFAYTEQGLRERSFAWLDPSTYYFYLRRIVVEHISPFYAAFALLAACVLLYFWIRRRAKSGMVWWVLVWWIVGAYVLMTFTLYRQSRAIMPILPPIALLTAAGLFMLPWRRLRSALVMVMLIGGILQLIMLSFTPFKPLVEASTLGTVRVFAQGGHIQWPDAGPNDPGWAVYDDVLQRLESVRRAQDLETISLGLLVNTPNINSTQFKPFLITSYPNLEVQSLARASQLGEPAYPRLFEDDFVALKRDNRFALSTEQVIIDRLLDDPPPVFSQVFELDKIYPLPDGDNLYLYKRRDFAPPDLEPAYVSELSAYLSSKIRPGDALLLDTPAMLAPLARVLADTPSYYLGPLIDSDLARIASKHQRILAIDWLPTSSDYTWLDRNTYISGGQWFGDIHLSTYHPPMDLVESTSGAQFGPAIVLNRVGLPEKPLVPGDLLPVHLIWQATQVPDQRYKAFVQLLAPDDQPVTQNDGEPVGWSRPTTSWQVGETIDDRRGILLPTNLPAGRYRLVVGWYPIDDGERLPVVSNSGELLGTELELGTFEILEPRP